MAFGSPGVYPFVAAGGRYFNKFRQLQADYEPVSDKHEYEDGGASFVLRNDTGIIRWVILYTGLTAAQFATFATHHADAAHEVFGFQITNPQTTTVYQEVHYLTWKEDHSKVWNVSLEVELIKRPA